MKIAPAPIPETGTMPLQQHPAFARALGLLGRRTMGVALGDAGHVQLVLRRAGPLTLALASRGPVWRAGASPQMRAQALRDLRRAVPGIGLLLLNPEEAEPIPGLRLLTPAHVAIVDLKRLSRASLAPKWRGALARADRANLRITQEALSADPDHWLLRADAAQGRLRGYRNWPPMLTAAFAAANPGAAQLFTAWHRGSRCAGALILRHGDSASYHIGHRMPDRAPRGAQNLLLWRAMEWLAERGAAQIDLGTVDTDGAPGLARFKLGTGAQPCALGGTWALGLGTRRRAAAQWAPPNRPVRTE